MVKNRPSKSSGFTLVELLVVIAIIAILAVVVLIIINPVEVQKRTRDDTRLSDMQNLQQAINVAVQDATDSATVLCNGAAAPCSGASYPVTTATRKNDGSGWVPVDLSSTKIVSVATLPVDPVNDATYHYSYSTNAAGSAYEIDTVLESDQQKGKMATDGGNNDNVYEVGTDLTILP